MDPEPASLPPETRSPKSYRTTLLLAYQSFGVVFGDLTVSPIYVYKSTFSGKLRLHEEDAEVLGVLSLVFWTLTLIALFKYVVIVLGADDNGEGGTFALYSLMCRSSKMGLMHAENAVPEHLVDCDMRKFGKETKTSLLVKNFFEKHQGSRILLLLFVLMGTSMVVGNGVLTPTMSGATKTSAHGLPLINRGHDAYLGSEEAKAKCLHTNQRVSAERNLYFGVSFVFFIESVRAWVWPSYYSQGGEEAVGVKLCCCPDQASGTVSELLEFYLQYQALASEFQSYMNDAGKDGWSSLGGVVLCITGAEAMFADLGHFSKFSIRMAFTCVVYPCLVLAYMGEAAYLTKHKEDLQSSFFKAIPEDIFWPVFIIATLATIVGSQAIISATFSIISQCRAFGCFPRVKIIHTSNHIHGQIYIPEANWIMMFLCLAVTIGFRDTDMIGNAYGLAVITVMLVTTCLMFLIIITVWNHSVLMAFLFIAVFGSFELFYFTACLLKFPHGGWFPFLLSLITLTIMSAWHYGTTKKLDFELENKVCLDWLLSLGPTLGLVRVPGVALVYANSIAGVPPMFAHFVTNFPAFHRVLIFVSVQTYMLPTIQETERFSIGRYGLKEHRMFWCIVKYGYKDRGRDSYDFENRLLAKVSEFQQKEHGGAVFAKKRVRFVTTGQDEECEDVKALTEEREAGVAYMMGNTIVVAREAAPWVKRFAIDGVYGFLRRNSRRPADALGVPHASLIEVCMVYHV